MIRRSRFIIAGLALAVLSSVASASVIDTVNLVTPSNLSFTDSQNVVYSLTATQPAGSGVFNPFMRIERDDHEQGYNSSLNNGPSATMDLINLPGNASSQLNMNDLLDSNHRLYLTLDYNEPSNSQSTIRLEELTLVVSTDPNKTGPAGPGNHDTWTVGSIPSTAGDLMIYQMSTALNGAGHQYTIQMDANKNLASGNGGSGAADLNVTLDLSQVANLASLLDGNHYLYVYSRFSDSESGYEEWSAWHPSSNEPPPTGGGIPEPASLGILALGAMGLMARRRR